MSVVWSTVLALWLYSNVSDRWAKRYAPVSSSSFRHHGSDGDDRDKIRAKPLRFIESHRRANILLYLTAGCVLFTWFEANTEKKSEGFDARWVSYGAI